MDWKRIPAVACACVLGLGLYSEIVGAAHHPACSRYQKDAAICAPVFEADMQPHSTEALTPIRINVHDTITADDSISITPGTGMLRIN